MAAAAEETVPFLHCFKSSFELFEQFAEASRGWDLDFRQLRPARSPFTLEQFSTPRMLSSRATLDSHFHQHAGTAVGYRTFALQTQYGSDYRWAGEAADRQSLVVMADHGEFESVSTPGFDIFTLSLPITALERTAEMEFQRPLASFLGPGGEVRYRVGDALRELRAVLHSLSHAVGQGQRFITTHYGAAGLSRLEHTLTHLILSCLERSDTQRPRGPRNKRMMALHKTLEMVEQTPPAELCLSNLVAQAGVSRRTLEYAFLDGLGVSPASYLKAIRLRSLHKELLTRQAKNTSVAELCLHNGFSHLGQLSADYRDMYGELPSATLRRGTATG